MQIIHKQENKNVSQSSAWSFLTQSLNFHGKYFFVVILLLFSAFLLSFGFVYLGVKASALVVLVVMAFAFLMFCLVNPSFGFYTTLVLPFIFFPLQRYLLTDIPFGLGIQIIYFFLILYVLLIHSKAKAHTLRSMDSPITYTMLLIFVYNLLQAFNPELLSLEGWYIVIRANIAILAAYLVTHLLFQDFKFVKYFFLVWMIMATLTALYACYQEWFGMPGFELRWVHQDIFRMKRIFIWGKYRKFSLLSDPASFGIFMAASSMVSFILFLKPDQKAWKKAILFISTILMLLGMSYSGTRTAYAMVPAGLMLISLMTINNSRTLIISLIVSAIGISMLFGPNVGNPTINRLRSTFDTTDPSFEVRNENRQSMQDYMLDHPIGGGVMTTGVGGLKFNPGHPLAGFPPDSGYLQMALETGWIGLFLYLLFLFFVLREGVINFYRSKSAKYRYYYLALTTFVFTIAIALYAQVSATQIPLALFFYPVAAIIGKLRFFELEKEKNKR